MIGAISDVTVPTDPGLSTASVPFSTTVSDNVDAAGSFTLTYSLGGNPITSPHAFPVGTNTVTVTSSADSAGNAAAPVTFDVTVNVPPNNAPTVSIASIGSVASGAPVTLVSTANANDVGQTLTYSWTQTSGPSVALTTTDQPDLTFTAPVLAINAPDEVLTFSLQVSDGIDTADAMVNVTVVAQTDTVAPDALTAQTAQVTVNADGSLTVSGVTEPGATVHATWPDGTQQSVMAAADGRFALTSGTVQPAGSLTMVVEDAAGNRSSAYTQQVTQFATVEEIRSAVRDFLRSRARHTLAAQPDLVGMMSGTATGRANGVVTRNQGNLDFATRKDKPVWFEASGQWSSSEGSDTSYFYGVLGGHAKINEAFWVGAMLSFDAISETDGDQDIDGQGYMFGPYFVAKLPDHPLYFEGRYLYGQSSNTIKIGTAPDSDFDSTRSLAQLKMAGELEYESLILIPSLTASHYTEKQDSFTDAANRVIAGQRYESTEVELGLDFSRTYDMSYGTFTLTGGVSGISAHESGDSVFGSNGDDNDVRGRVRLGGQSVIRGNTVLSAEAFYDGIGTGDFRNFGVIAGLQMQF